MNNTLTQTMQVRIHEHLLLAEIVNPNDPDDAIVLTSMSRAVASSEPQIYETWKALAKVIFIAAVKHATGAEIVGVSEEIPVRNPGSCH